MTANCVICSDLFTAASDTFVTSCGHVFHYVCIIKWIERSKSCPQCRNKVTEKSLQRLYLNYPNTDGNQDDAATLQHKLDSLHFTVRQKDKDLKNLQEKYENANAQSTALRMEFVELEKENQSKKSTILLLKDRLEYLKDKAKNCEKLIDELKRLKTRQKSLEEIHAVITGSKNDADDILRQNRDPYSLSLMASTLKKELVDSDHKRKKLFHSMKDLQHQIVDIRNENQKLQTENERLKSDIEVHKNCEAERKYLKNKIVELEEKCSDNSFHTHSHTSNNSIQRIIRESPAPFMRMKLDSTSDVIDLDVTESPNVETKVKRTLESDSPYLNLKSNNFGLSNYMGKSLQVPKEKKFSIFKPQATYSDTFKIPKKDYVYDGLGGHKKDEKFPSPSKVQLPTKRPKSTSSIPPNKFRKLAPNKKLNDFFSKTQE